MSNDPVPDPFHAHDHAHCAAAVLRRAEDRAHEAGLRLTPVRRRALEILLESHRALGAYEVLERLAADGFGKQPPVAYRALDFLVEQGLAHRVQRLNAYAACLSAERDHSPAFLICRNCGALAELAAASVAAGLASLASESGFAVERVTIEAMGLCPACAEDGA